MRLTPLTKAETALLEPFAGLSLECIHLPKSPEALAAAGREIIAAGIAGFDTESKPTFRPGEKSDGPHVVQFALADRAYLFQMAHPDSRALVAALLQSKEVLKVGFGLKGDRAQIRSKLGVPMEAVLDLNQIFRKRGYRGQIGVRAAIGALLQQSFPKSKRITTSNWANPVLTPGQLLYAANDAFAAWQVKRALDAGAERRRDRGLSVQSSSTVMVGCISTLTPPMPSPRCAEMIVRSWDCTSAEILCPLISGRGATR